MSSHVVELVMQDPQLAESSRKGKGREGQAPQPTDFAEKLVALRRKQAGLTKPRERTERPQAPSTSTPRTPAHPPSPRRTHASGIIHPSIIVSQASFDTTPDEHEFSRKLKIAPTSPRHSHSRAEHSSPRGSGRLYNPHAEPSRRQLVTAEPDAMSEAASSSYATRPPAPPVSRNHHRSQAGRSGADAHRLFDPRKDDPHQFNAQARPQAMANGASSQNGRPTPTPKSSGDWVSASSTSSYAQSTISSNFTLNTTTTESSASSAIFDNGQPRSEDSTASSNALSQQLKNLYRSIIALEGKLSSPERDVDMQDDIYEDAQRIGFLQKGQPITTRTRQEEEAEQDRYRKMMKEHKDLADVVHQLLCVTLSPNVPVSLRNIPIKYNLVSRLWLHAFHRLLESLRRAATSSAFPEIALENLVEFIYYAYTFYAGLMDEQNLAQFRSNWVECLGDIARYRIAVTALLENHALSATKTLPVNSITRAALSSNQHLATGANTPDASARSDKHLVSAVDSPVPVARIDDSPPPSVGEIPHQPAEFVPSVGVVAARMMELEPEKERWRQVSKEWYAKGLAFQPNSGKLHHHLGVLSRDREGSEKEELRAVYHFVKSMITLHPFSTSREAVLPIWSQPAQSRRQAPDATLTELFVLLHGMIFTNIQLDDFKGVLARFEEKLMIEGDEVQERDWIMMAVINIGAVLEYGRSTAVLRRVSGIESRHSIPGSAASPILTNGSGKVKLISKRTDGAAADDRRMDVDEDAAANITGIRAMAISQASPASSHAEPTEPELPLGLKSALQLTFGMLAHALRKPTLPQTSAVSHPRLNPYITIILTFLATTLKDKSAEQVLTRSIPWKPLAAFLSAELPRKIMFSETQRESPLLSSGCFPLNEDWCLRGLGWGGKKVYERGFWDKATRGEEKSLESEVLDKLQAVEVQDGVIEDDQEDDEQAKYRAEIRRAELYGRWIRVARAALKITKIVGGFSYTPPPNKDLRGQWHIEGQLANRVARWREEERLERLAEERRLRGIRWNDDDDMDVDDDEQMGDEAEYDSDEDVSDEVKALKERFQYLSSFLGRSQQTPSKRQRARAQREAGELRMVPGYTTLVIDTNILLSSLPVVTNLVESLKWTVVIPLPVIMELDGLASDSSPLGDAAKSASASIISHLRSHNTSLKVLTSKGNYLPNLNIRTEQVDFDGHESSWERNMDDLILRAAIWQTEHWVDRSMFLKVTEEVQTAGASKVALLTFDRMLRLKARSREVDAPSERDLASLLSGKP